MHARAAACMAMLAGMPLWTDICHAGEAAGCGPSQLGQPCPQGGLAAQGAAEPSLNLGAGNPIHVVTGNKYQRETDLSAAPGTVGLEIVRHYNARDPRVSALGKGWSLSYDTRLHAGKAGRRTQIAQADGSRADFLCDAGRTCHPAGPARGTLHRADDGWSWNWPDGRRLLFDPAGRLAGVTGTNGQRLAIRRETAAGPVHGQILRVSDEQGRSLDFSYEIIAGRARLAHIDAPAGRYVYRHDTAGTHGAPRLTAARHPGGWTREYLYEPALQAGDPFGLTGIVLRNDAGNDARGHGAQLRTHSWAYDSTGRAVLSVHGDPHAQRDRVDIEYVAAPGADGSPGLTRVRSQAGITLFRTALRGGRAVLTSVEGAGCPGCAPPGLAAGYDASGHLVQINGLRIRRDAQGRVAALAPAAGWPGLVFAYDVQGRLASWTSHATGREDRRRDTLGRIAERRHANGDVWQYAYDAAGRPVEIVARSARRALRTTIAWRGGLPARIRHPHESESRRHDARGRLVAREVQRPPLVPGGRGYTYRERYAWDDAGRMIRHDLPEGGSLVYHWNGPGRLAGIEWEDGAGRRQVLMTTDGAGYVHGNGLRVRGLVRQGRLDTLAVDYPAQDPTTPPASPAAPVFLQRLVYDDAGRIAAEGLDAAGWRATLAYAYGPDARMTGASARLAGSPVAAGHEWRYAWRASGAALATRTGTVTQTHAYRRDASGLPLAIGPRRLHYGPDRRLASVTQGGHELARYAHNAYGERVHRRSTAGSAAYLYMQNQLAAEARPLPDGGVGVIRRYVYAGWLPIALIDYGQPQALRAHGPYRAAQPRFHAVHADAAGMPHIVTDAARRVRWRAAWSPTGKALAVQGDLTLTLRQPGHFFDDATGWHDNYLRTFDPTAGHYLEPDPAGPLPDSEPYGYAAQQPRRHADPLGLLLFSFDGTRNDPSSRTNVWLMNGWYAGGAAHYRPGPGTPGTLDLDMATAGSAPRILQAQWRDLLEELAAAPPGNAAVPIDLLGFSRGAALAMQFGNHIAAHRSAGRFWVRDAALGMVTACVDLRFMGLFDPVAQFGLLGADNGAYDLSISAEWQWVAHAVALHERRWLFPLTAPEGRGTRSVVAPFLGAHADIGGGYLEAPADPETAQPGGDLSDVALNWMLRQAAMAGAPFGPPPAAYARVDNPLLHDERTAAARLAGTDRAVLGAGGERLLSDQGKHPRYGDAMRERVEAFIARAEGWAALSDVRAGTVDMRGYSAWLRETLDLDLAP